MPQRVCVCVGVCTYGGVPLMAMPEVEEDRSALKIGGTSRNKKSIWIYKEERETNVEEKILARRRDEGRASEENAWW